MIRTDWCHFQDAVEDSGSVEERKNVIEHWRTGASVVWRV